VAAQDQSGNFEVWRRPCSKRQDAIARALKSRGFGEGQTPHLDPIDYLRAYHNRVPLPFDDLLLPERPDTVGHLNV